MSILSDVGKVFARQLLDDMRLMRHPAKDWVQERMYGRIEIVSRLGIDRALVNELMAEADALRRDKPAKPYQRTQAVPSFEQCQQ